MKAILAVAVLTAAVMTLTQARAQDASAGEQVFKKCLPCHAVGEGAKNKIGPELNGLDGRKAGTAPDYNYSAAMKSSGIVWNEQTFAEYIKDPRAKVPRTKMIFSGVKDEKEIASLWAYLKQFGPEGRKK
jgi:cytochrome c